jgi:hydroxymethylglutaryl-CoA lyase
MAASIRTLAQSIIGRSLPTTVKIVEVGPRDGLQSEKTVLATGLKVVVHRLVAAGLTTVEVTSFVSPKWVPQMADNSQVFRELGRTNRSMFRLS